MDDEVAGAAGAQGLAAAFQQLAEEARVDVAELVHAGEQPLHHAGLELQLLQHARAEQPCHDLQRPHVVQLRLDELCGATAHQTPHLGQAARAGPRLGTAGLVGGFPGPLHGDIPHRRGMSVSLTMFSLYALPSQAVSCLGQEPRVPSVAPAENRLEGRSKDGAWETKSPQRWEPYGNAGAGGKGLGGLWANRVLGGTTGWRKVVDKPWSARGAWRPGLTVDDILLLHHLLLLLLQEAAVHGQAPRVGCEVPLVRLKVTHQLAVDHLCTWTSAGPTLSPTPLAGPRPPQACPGRPSPSSMRDSTDRVRFRMLRESVDWDRIRRSPRGDSSLKCLRGQGLRHPDSGDGFLLPKWGTGAGV